MATAITVPAPQSARIPSAALWLAAFVVVQILDGVFSYVGVQMHGHWIEGNPLVAWYAAALGPGVGFLAAKLFAVACGAILFVTARHHWVALLTVVYVVFAIVPWLSVLSMGSLL